VKKVKKILLKHTKLSRDVIGIILNTINKSNNISKINLDLYNNLNTHRDDIFNIHIQINEPIKIEVIKSLLVKNNLRLIKWSSFRITTVLACGKSKDILKLLEIDFIKKMTSYKN
jgi:hypothetical protein